MQTLFSLDVARYPLREGFFSQVARCESQECHHALRVGCSQLLAVEIQKKFSDDESCPFVSVDERMIPDQAECVARRKSRKIG